MENNNNEDKIELEDIPSEQEDLDIDNASYEIKTYGADFTIEILSKKFDTKEIIVPDFQRKYVWPPKKASRLIESFLLGLPVPQVFLYREEENQDLLVVDGQQRLKTINYFIKELFENETEFYLRGVKPEWEGKKYSTLTEPDRRRFNNYILRATIFEQVDPKDHSSIFEIFERLNTGGMPLNEQEIRRCVVRGKINSFIEELNLYPNWRKLLKKESPDARMKDIEMILRFFALWQNWKDYKKPMKDFVTEFMRKNKDISDEKQTEYSQVFKDVVDKIYTNVGEDAFRLKAGINIAIFDSIMAALALIGVNNTNDLKSKITILKTNNAYLDSVSKSTTDSDRVEARMKLAIQTLK
ncbi:MAG: hypothetical protein LiPW30_662 [Parcubacteria group bacterium LiPW_30]|nr:MAG: hypothetical protein LiPW30_662 [Parcubacteria group bacterium LiPW_30]